jgi:hypothetical protein
MARRRKVTKHRPDAVHQVQCHLRAKLIVAHVDRLAPYLGGCSGQAALRRGQCDILGYHSNVTAPVECVA